MHLFHVPQCSIQNRNVHISVLNGALWDIEQEHSVICKIGLLTASGPTLIIYIPMDTCRVSVFSMLITFLLKTIRDYIVWLQE